MHWHDVPIAACTYSISTAAEGKKVIAGAQIRRVNEPTFCVTMNAAVVDASEQARVRDTMLC